MFWGKVHMCGYFWEHNNANLQGMRFIIFSALNIVMTQVQNFQLGQKFLANRA